MQEPHSEGVANHADLESCAGGGDIGGEALTEALVGGAIEPRNPEFWAPTLWTEGEGHIVSRAIASGRRARRGRRTSARQETPCARTGRPPRRSARTSRPVGEGSRRTTHAHVAEESDQAGVPAKGPNKGEPSPAEGLEGRAWAKENTGQSRTVCPQRQSYGVPAAARERSGNCCEVSVLATIRGKSRMS